MSDRDTQQELGQQVLSFTAGGTDYAVPITKVREILQYESVTEIPAAPPSVRGVTNVRGAAVPVVDLAARLGRGASSPTGRSCILVVEVAAAGEHLALGVFADQVNEVVELRAADLEPPPSFGAGVKLSYLVGLGKIGKGFVLLLDLDRALTASEVELAAELAAAGGTTAAA